MKITAGTVFIITLFLSCAQNKSEMSVETITNQTLQASLFKDVFRITNKQIPEKIKGDSIAILLLPIQSICPACRKKIIDSIVSNENELDDRHFIIISANGGKKTMEAYFRELGKKWPNIQNGLFLDSTNEAFKNKLYTTKPIFFYSYQQKIYKKVSSVPATVKEDLRFFFNN